MNEDERKEVFIKIKSIAQQLLTQLNTKKNGKRNTKN